MVRDGKFLGLRSGMSLLSTGEDWCFLDNAAVDLLCAKRNVYNEYRNSDCPEQLFVECRKSLLVAVPIHRLDVSRHFFYPADVKHLLRTMALFKMNHFHWHLTDDQGWHFPVAKYPNLIRLGAFRRASPLGHTDRTDNTPYNHLYWARDWRRHFLCRILVYSGTVETKLATFRWNLHEFTWICCIYRYIIYPQILDDYRSRQGRVRRLHSFI